MEVDYSEPASDAKMPGASSMVQAAPGIRSASLIFACATIAQVIDAC